MPLKRKLPIVRILAVIVILAVGAMLFLQNKQRELAEICTFNRGEPEDTLAACDTLLNWMINSPQGISLTHRHRMRVFMAQQDWAAAEREVDLAITADPQSATPWQWKAKVLTETKDYDRALESIEQALVLVPSSDYSLEFKAKLLRRLDRFDEIETLVEDAVINYEVGPWAWSYAGYFRLKADEYRSSALAFAEALRVDPKDSYDRRKFLEACQLAGPECPPLFPDRRANYPQLSCEEAVERFDVQYPGFAEGALPRAGYATLHELVERGGSRATALVQASYIATTIAFRSRNPQDFASRLIVDSRMLDCVSGGELYYPETLTDADQRRFTIEHRYGAELRRNLVDLAYTDLP